MENEKSFDLTPDDQERYLEEMMMQEDMLLMQQFGEPALEETPKEETFEELLAAASGLPDEEADETADDIWDLDDDEDEDDFPEEDEFVDEFPPLPAVKAAAPVKSTAKATPVVESKTTNVKAAGNEYEMLGCGIILVSLVLIVLLIWWLISSGILAAIFKFLFGAAIVIFVGAWLLNWITDWFC